MALIDKDKAVRAISMYLFINDLVKDRVPNMKVSDYDTFARSILADVPEIEPVEIIHCKDCLHWQLLSGTIGLCVWNDENKRQMGATEFCSHGRADRKE